MPWKTLAVQAIFNHIGVDVLGKFQACKMSNLEVKGLDLKPLPASNLRNIKKK